MTMMPTTHRSSRRGRHGQDHGRIPFQSFVFDVSVVFILASLSVAASHLGGNHDVVTLPKSFDNRHALALHRSLQFSSTTTPDLASLFTNGTEDCPVDCPLCECALPTTTNSSNANTNTTISEAEVESCIYTKSIEACASGSLPKCYAGLLPFDFDIEGLCSVQCDDATSQQQQQGVGTTNTATICRICDIFACCNNCPAGDVDQCFPPMSSDSNGYTPVGWKPLSCDGDGSGGGSTTSGGSGGNRNDVVMQLVLVTVATWLAWQV